MTRLTKFAGLAVLVAVLAALALSSTALAHSAAPARSAAPLSHGFGGRGLCGQAGLDAAAKALKMTTDELTAQLWGGRTLADLADEAGVELTDVQSAVQAACTAATKAAIQQAVTDGQITQDQADWLIEGLDKGYWGSGQKSFGFGGFGRGHHGFGLPRGSAPQTTPQGGATTPSRFVF